MVVVSWLGPGLELLASFILEDSLVRATEISYSRQWSCRDRRTEFNCTRVSVVNIRSTTFFVTPLFPLSSSSFAGFSVCPLVGRFRNWRNKSRQRLRRALRCRRRSVSLSFLGGFIARAAISFIAESGEFHSQYLTDPARFLDRVSIQ